MDKKIQAAYKQTTNIYDDVLTGKTWWSKLYLKLFWQNIDDVKIAEKVLSYIPNDFNGNLLDVPVGTAVFTAQKYKQLSKAQFYCLDYSEEMLYKCKARLKESQVNHVKILQGDVGKLPFDNEYFDIVLSMNGFHAFPNKEAAYMETARVLRKDGKFIGCFYIKGECKRTDWLVKNILSKKGFFTPPFETKLSLKKRLSKNYIVESFWVEGSIAYFLCTKIG